MSGTAKVYWLHALTSVHVGVGQGIGFIDLPIMREKLTQWPIVPGTAVKGVVKQYYLKSGLEQNMVDLAFGKSSGQNTGYENAGAVVFTDARIVALPIRSYYGTFAYVTSPLVLKRLKRDLHSVDWDGIPSDVPDMAGEMLLTVARSKLVQNGKVYLEEYDFNAKEEAIAEEWAKVLGQAVFRDDEEWRKIFQERFAIVQDDIFNFISESATEVNARVRIDPTTGTVAKGALWYEENLPAETILAGIVWSDQVARNSVEPETLLNRIANGQLHLQIGGKATVGKGKVRCVFSGGNEK